MGQSKLSELTDTAEVEPATPYQIIEPVLPLGLPFALLAVNQSWSDCPSLPDLFPTSFPGVKTSHDSFLVDIGLDKLKTRVHEYFDSGEVQQVGPEEAGFVRYVTSNSKLCRSSKFELTHLKWVSSSAYFSRRCTGRC